MPWATGAPSAPATFGQWLHSAEAQQVPPRPAPKAAFQPDKSLALLLPRPVPVSVGRSLNGSVGTNANASGSRIAAAPRPRSSALSDPASPAPALAIKGKDGGAQTTNDTATDPSALADPPSPSAVPLATPPTPPSAWGSAAPRNGSNAAGDVPDNNRDDTSPGLQTAAQAMLRTAATASFAGSPADGSDTPPADPAGIGRLVFGASRLATAGLSLAAWRAGSASAHAAGTTNAAGTTDAANADGDAPIPEGAAALTAPAGLPVGKALAGAIGLALAAASARKPDAQPGTASTDATLVAAGLAERSPVAMADTIAPSTLTEGIAITLPGARPLATLSEADALHQVNIATALTDPGFAPALGATLTLLARDGIEQARLNLHPAEMGPITVQISLDGTAARVDFQADVAATRAALEAALPALASALQEAGLSLSGGGVFQPSAEGQSPQGGAQSSQAQAGGQGGQDQPWRQALLNPAAGLGAEPQRGTAKAPRGIVDLVA